MEEPNFTKGQKGYLKRFVNEFQKEAKSELDNFKNESNQKINDLIKIKSDFQSSLTNVNKNESELNDKLSSHLESLNYINEFYDKIFTQNENGLTISDNIDNFKMEFQEKMKEIHNIKSEIENYKKEVFGYTNDKGEIVLGFKNELNNLKSNYKDLIKTMKLGSDNLIKQNNKKYNEFFESIESLLKGASTVALAKAFKEHKESFIKPNKFWMIIFILSILSMMFFSVWSFKNTGLNIDEMWKHSLGNLPFIGGAVWLAIYSSKQRSQNKRLQQEYAFKEDIAKIYYGLKKEVEELGNSNLGKKLNELVLKLVIETVSLNPSKSLESDSHNDKGPILESIKSISPTFKTKE